MKLPTDIVNLIVDFIAPGSWHECWRCPQWWDEDCTIQGAFLTPVAQCLREVELQDKLNIVEDFE